MSLSSVLQTAASHRTGGARSFPASYDATIQRNYTYRAPDVSYAKLWFRQVDGLRPLQPANQAAGWIIPEGASDCHPVLVAHSLLAALWLLQEMLPAALTENGWQQLVDAAQVLSNGSATPLPPPSAQQPAPIQMEDSDVDVTTDPESDLDGVQSRKRNEPPASLARPREKRACTPAHRLAASAADEPRLVVTVTNNNRRTDARIQKKISQAQERKLGLLPPTKHASVAEKQAYHAIAPADVKHISWLFKQSIGTDNDLYHTASSPYKTVCEMLSKARVVGHEDAWSNAASFLRSWRQHGTPFCSQAPAAPTSALSQRLVLDHSNKTASDNAIFAYAWHMCDYYDSQLASATIKYRWAMALLGRAYANNIAQLQDSDRAASSDTSRNRYGKGQVRTEAVRSLLQAVSGDSPSKQQKTAFRLRLARAARWYTAASTLGWGSLCLMPPEAISNTWAGKTLTRPEWDIWLDLIQKIQPDACTASRALDAWLGAEGIEGGSIKGKETLCIEAGAPEVEIADSEMDSASDSDSSPAPTPPPALRQLTLLELFQPR
jgi:hypothetical protein